MAVLTFISKLPVKHTHTQTRSLKGEDRANPMNRNWVAREDVLEGNLPFTLYPLYLLLFVLCAYITYFQLVFLTKLP